MTFTGSLNYAGTADGTSTQMGISTAITDARPLFDKSISDSSHEILLNGRGFLLVAAPSKVVDWTNTNEVSNI